jgi:cytoskeletal protein CcmA (bactofilin family)
MAEQDPLRNATNVSDHGETIFTRNTSFNGVLKTDGAVRIYGAFEGEIETAGPVIIGKSARVAATISAHDVGVAGTMLGNISAAGKVEIYSGGRVQGDIVARALRVDDGAVFSGRSTMRDDADVPFLVEAPGTALDNGHGR